MPILKKSKKSSEKIMLPFLSGEAENSVNSSSIESVNRSIPQKLLRGAVSSKTVTLGPLKEMNPPSVAQAPDAASEVAHVPMQVTKIDYKALDLQVQRYRQEAEETLSRELSQYKAQFLGQLERERNQILDQGYQDGYNKGQREGRTILENQAEEFLGAMNALTREKGDVFAQAKPEILKLSVKTAGKIVQKAIEEHPELYEAIIDEAIARVTDKDKVIIRVNPKQIDVVRKYKDRLLERINDIKSLEIQGDPKIDDGGCMIETKLGYVDATLSVKLATIQNALFRVMDENA